MAASEELVADLAGAILDGTPIDWASAESSADETQRPLLDQLRLLASVADLHRRLPLPSAARLDEAERSRAGLDEAERNRAAAPTVTATPPRVENLADWGHLRLLEPIGRGAFGIVYRAWDTRLDREVALKLLPAGSATGDARAMSIIEEGRLLARVRHPNVVTIYGAERIEDQVGLWMDFVRGRTLEQVIEEGKIFSPGEATNIGIEICQAVSAVHRKGLLHRDIKAHNVMLADDGRVVLMDFGTGREFSDTSASLAGTPLYLAPELLSGGKATAGSDVYSIGVLLYHLLTGSYPVRARDLKALRSAHARRERMDLKTARPDLPPRLAVTIERAIDSRVERRYQSADALGADLARLRARRARRPLTYALGAAAALVLTIGITWETLGRQNGSARTPSALLPRLVGLVPAGALKAGPIERPIIAVLPLKNLSAEPDSDFFVDGLTDEIIRNLAVIEGLQVRSRTSSFAFRDKPRNLRDVGEQLGANLVVEGSVLRSGRRLRINAQLVQVAGDVPLWAERFDRELEDVFAIQDEISRTIVNKLRLTLGRGQRRYDTSVEAYDLYLKARVLQARRGPSTRQALDLFEQVVAKDPAFAPAHAALASTYAELSSNFPVFGGFAIPPEQAYKVIRPAALRAIELDPLLAEAHAAMGFAYSLERNWAKAAESFRHALELDPSLTTIYTDFVLSTLVPEGKLDEALLQLEAALRADPLSLDVRRVMATVQISAGHYDAALDNCRRVLAVDPEFPFAEEWCARALLHRGEVTEAIARFETHRDRNEGWLGYAYAVSGRRIEAQALAAKNGRFPQRQVLIYAGLGDKDRAFEALERLAALNARRAGSYLNYPELAVLRGDPRRAALRKKLGFSP